MEIINLFYAAIFNIEILEFLRRFFTEMFDNEISAFFTAIIILYFAFCVLTARINSQKLRQFSSSAPSVLTILGILGTFTGIFIALLEFDVN